jgi:hypothetical protein
MAVVQLVRMQHRDLSRSADLGAAAVVERLDASSGQADAIGIVAMLVIRMPVKPRLQELHAMLRLRAAHPVRR